MIHTSAPDGKPLSYHRSWAELPDIIQTAAKTAALMGAERPDRLSGKIKMFQKCENCHRHRTPVIGIPQIDRIVSADTVRPVPKLRTCIALLVLLSLGDALIVVLRVRLHRLNLKQIRPGQLLQDRSSSLCISSAQHFDLSVHIVLISS